MKSLTPEQVKQYHEQGYLAPLDGIAREQAEAIFRYVQDFEASVPPDEAKKGLGTKSHLLHPPLYDLLFAPRILDAVESILGPNLLVWGSGFFYKKPRDGGYVSWHQDSTYWGLEPFDIVTAWVAMTPSRRENGCMRVVPGTHAKGQLPHADTFDRRNLLSRGQEIQVEVDEKDARDIVLEPGQFSLHHVGIVHGSDPNNSDLPRYGFTIRYIPTYVRQIGGRTSAVLVRGTDEYGYYDPEPRPEKYGPEAIRVHEEAMARVESILYTGAAEKGRRVTAATAAE
jgi:non-haem Fe2+, alpha-ketoglutarate-dependent halogenase